MLEVTTLSVEEEGDYARWLLSSPESLIYYSSIFHKFIRSVVGGSCEVLVAKENGRFVGTFPYFKREHPNFGTVINSSPWYGSHGGCFISDRSARHVRASLINEFARILAQVDLLSATVIVSPWEYDYVEDYVAVLKPRTTDLRIGQMTYLPLADGDSERQLESVLLQKTRNLVRKACKQGFEEVLSDEDWAWEFLHKTHMENMNAIGGKAKPWAHFQALRATIPPDARRLTIALLQGVPVAAMLLLLFNRTVEYITPAIVNRYRALQPLSFLIWKGMHTAMQHGFSFWNWGGTWSTQKTLHHFKAGWGSKDMPYCYLVLANDRGIERISSATQEASAAFPFYYVFPFAQLPSRIAVT